MAWRSGGKAFVDDVAAEGERQTILGLPPPDTEISGEDEALVLIGELAFVNDEADIGAVFANGLEDLVERDDEAVEFGGGLAEEKLEREKGTGHGAGDGDAEAGDFGGGKLAFGDEHGAIAIAHAGTAGEKGVLVANVSIGMDADGADVEFAASGAFVEGLDVLEDVFELVWGWDELAGEGVKHEGIIRIRRAASASENK
jgi:hypothetical protein